MACAQIGTGSILSGTMSVSLSTSAQVILRVSQVHRSAVGKLTFHPSALPHTWYSMGSVFTGGLGVQWGYEFLMNKKRMELRDYDYLDRMSVSMSKIPPGSNGLLFLPFLVGSGSPFFDARDRAAWIGLTLEKDKSSLLHSVMEGVAYNIKDAVVEFEKTGEPLERIHLSGGGSSNPVWCRMIANILGNNIQLLKSKNTSALGAAIIAGVGVGVHDSLEAAATKAVRTEREYQFDPEIHERYRILYKKYQQLYAAVHEYYINL